MNGDYAMVAGKHSSYTEKIILYDFLCQVQRNVRYLQLLQLYALVTLLCLLALHMRRLNLHMDTLPGW